MNEIIQRAKKTVEHPVMASLTTITVVGAALTALMNMTGWYERAHTSDAEIHAVRLQLEKQIGDVNKLALSQANLATCQSLAVRISIIENQIWQMEQASENSPRLVEKKRELADLESKYRFNNCSNLLR